MKAGPGACCRTCGAQEGLQLAHTIGREFDSPYIGSQQFDLYVDPDSVVPLCRGCHQMYDAHEIDLLGKLTVDEEMDAVKRAGGLENARVRLCPTAYRKERTP